MNRKEMVLVKEKILHILNEKEYIECDSKQLEYLIQYIDWIILGEIPMNKETLITLMEEIITTAVHQLNLDLLDVLKDLGDLEEIYCGN